MISYTPELYLNGKKNGILSRMYKETKFLNTTWYHWLITNMHDQVKECAVLNSVVTKVKYSKYRVGRSSNTLCEMIPLNLLTSSRV